MNTTMITLNMEIKTRRPRILIAGLGNYLLKDDGVGVHAVKALQQHPLPGVIVAEVGTAVLGALHLFEWAEKILAIDAMRAEGRPGTIYAFGVEDAAGPEMQASLHELNLMAALKFLNPKSKPEILIVGMEPETIDYGLELSPPVAAALPDLIREVSNIVIDWTKNLRSSAFRKTVFEGRRSGRF